MGCGHWFEIHWLRIQKIFVHCRTFSKNTYYNDIVENYNDIVENYNESVENGISGNLKLVSIKRILGLPVQIMSVDTAVW